MYRISNRDNIYTVSVYKIYFLRNSKKYVSFLKSQFNSRALLDSTLIRCIYTICRAHNLCELIHVNNSPFIYIYIYIYI